jgi:elongation factor Ts
MSSADFQPSAAQVKSLRDRTDLPMMECKKALVQAKGDIEHAIKILREQGEKIQSGKAGRETGQGRIEAYRDPNGQVIGIVQMKCEQAPSAKNEKFAEMTKALARQAALQNVEPTVENLLDQPDIDNPSHKANDRLVAVMNFIRENMGVARVARLKADGGALGAYVHFDYQQAAVIRLQGPSATTELANDIATHVVATKPLAIRREDFPKEVVDRERDIARKQAEQTGKPANLVDKIAEGKLNTFFAENALIEQVWVKDNKSKIRELLGANTTVTHMIRFRVGEAIGG